MSVCVSFMEANAVSNDGSGTISSTEANKHQQQQDDVDQQSSTPAGQPVEELDPTAKDAEGWPLLHRVVMAAVSGALPPLAASPTDAGTSTSTASTSSDRSLPSLDAVLAVCKDVNLKGPGGFTALHMACLGTLTAQQRKYVRHSSS